jgi:hypothetical protein
MTLAMLRTAGSSTTNAARNFATENAARAADAVTSPAAQAAINAGADRIIGGTAELVTYAAGAAIDGAAITAKIATDGAAGAVGKAAKGGSRTLVQIGVDAVRKTLGTKAASGQAKPVKEHKGTKAASGQAKPVKELEGNKAASDQAKPVKEHEGNKAAEQPQTVLAPEEVSVIEIPQEKPQLTNEGFLCYFQYRALYAYAQEKEAANNAISANNVECRLRGLPEA